MTWSPALTFLQIDMDIIPLVVILITMFEEDIIKQNNRIIELESI